MNYRSLFVSIFTVVLSALLFFFANGALAESGAYQRTKDGKAVVWNNHPLPGDMAAWFGDRDEDGYATGYGTLVWYATEKKVVTGSNLPMAKQVPGSRYSGMMVRGKFDGLVVNVDANGKTFHGMFVDGKKSKNWTAGPAPAAAVAAQKRKRSEEAEPEVVEQKIAAAETENTERPEPNSQIASTEEEPEPPAAGPNEVPQEKAKTKQPVIETAVETKEKPKAAMDDSLRSLISPPHLLQMNAKHEASPQASAPPKAAAPASPPPAATGPRLTATEVIELANAEAKKQGYNPGEYQRPLADYMAEDGTWSVSYDQKNADGLGKHFSVSVEDKTKKAAIGR